MRIRTMQNKIKNSRLIYTLIFIFVCLLAFGCRTQNDVGYINPYDLVSAVNSFDKTDLMHEMELSLTSLGQVFIPTEETNK